MHKTSESGPQVPDEYLYRVVDALDEVAKEAGKTVSQIALIWLLQRPTAATVVWTPAMTADQVAKLDAASKVPRPYPYWHQVQFASRNPLPVPEG